MDSASLPLILLAAAPVLKNHCLEGGKIQNRQGKRNALHLRSVPVWYDDSINRIGASYLCVFNHLEGSHCGVQKEKNKWGNILMFLLSLPRHKLAATACPTCIEMLSFMRKEKKKKEKKAKQFFLLSLNCHERSPESACRGWDSAEGCEAQERRPPSPTAQSHILSKRKRLALSPQEEHKH